MPDRLTLLEIQFSGGSLRSPGDAWCNRVAGGPESLLRWLENQLGLHALWPEKTERIAEYAGLLDAQTDPEYRESLAADRWGTAAELLARRDELRLAGWDGSTSPALPGIVRDMAVATQGKRLLPDERDRLDRVAAALKAGQKLPPHRLILMEEPDCWPPAWQGLLRALDRHAPPAVTPHGTTGTTLRAAQALVLGGDAATLAPDGSLRWFAARSVQTACEAVAKALAAEPARLADTAILCETPAAAVCLDACLARLGLPTMGASVRTRAHPILQVLPLALRLCWEPVDPETLLSFLTLPVNPLLRYPSRKLVEALSRQPGLGSEAWNEARRELEDPGEPGKGGLGENIARRMADWFDLERVPAGKPLKTALACRICNQTMSWAHGNRVNLPPDQTERIEAFALLARHALSLRNLLETVGDEIPEPQLARLLASVQGSGAETGTHREAAGGPALVHSLAEIRQPFGRLVWLGLGTADPVPGRWTAGEVRQLKDSGISLEHGSRLLGALRDAERHGLARIRESVLAVSLPADAELRPHPVWNRILLSLPAELRDEPIALSDAIDGIPGRESAPWRFPAAEFEAQPAPRPRTHWDFPAGSIRERSSCSAKSLESRLACPLKWALNYAANLRPSRIASIPSHFQLKGLFLHSILEKVFGNDDLPKKEVGHLGGAALFAKSRVPPSPDEAAESAGRLFEQRLPLDAAPLAAPHRSAERRTLQQQLVTAARKLALALREGGYRVAGVEVEPGGSFEGVPLRTYMDCLVVREDGREAILDAKYTGSKFRHLIQDGRATQLALYAYARSTVNQGRFPAVGYLVLDTATLITPDADPILAAAATRVPGPPIAEVWRRFQAALETADAWRRGTEPVTARPLLPAEQWPAGADLVIEESEASERAGCEPCRYCDYKPFCGVESLT